MSRGSSAGAAVFVANLVGILALASGCSETSMVVEVGATVVVDADELGVGTGASI